MFRRLGICYEFGAIACAAVLLITGGPGSGTAVAQGQVQVGMVEVGGADVVGGYASDHILVKVRGGVEPARLVDGRWTFKRSGEAGKPPGAALPGAKLSAKRASEAIAAAS